MNRSIVVLITAVLYGFLCAAHQPAMWQIKSIDDLVGLFPKTVEELEHRAADAIADYQQTIKDIIAIPSDKRTYSNTMAVIDRLCAHSDLAIIWSVATALNNLSPDDALRETAHELGIKIQTTYKQLFQNEQLYLVVKEYKDTKSSYEKLSAQQNYFLDELCKQFMYNGAHLPAGQRVQAVQLNTDIVKLEEDFGKNISDSKLTVTVDSDSLQGLSQDFINALGRTDDGKYILTTDYPTAFGVLADCSAEETRRRMLWALNNRAYPDNELLLKKLIAKRDEYAKLLGFESFAHLNLDNSMAGSVERVQEFLGTMHEKITKKMNLEYARMQSNLPEGVTKTADGKFKRWDISFINSCYRKKYLNLDWNLIQEYFPLDSTIEGLLDIYHNFLSIDFKEVPAQGLWHPDVRLVQVADSITHQIIGYIILDLHPRPHKYSHVCELPIVVTGKYGEWPAASIIVTNFTKPTETKPSLLSYGFLNTFFHEFGHALHELLASTEVAFFAGTRVKRDFVEMPSQMLEEWLCDKDILKKLSCHYKTGQQLSDELIDAIVDNKSFSRGLFLQNELLCSYVSLECFTAGADKDPQAIYHKATQKAAPSIFFSPEEHWIASFAHLTGYGAQYYGYLWSRVYALDLFSEIKKHGLLNPDIGRKYVQEVLSKGGSQDPNQLLANFLGREPNADAFFNDMGI